MNPKYQIVAEALRSGILDGTYQKTLPTEQALCAQFQVSRQTVRQALSLLETERLIDRVQGSGSHIREQKAQESGRHLSIAVVTTYISDYIFPSILREIEAVCSENRSAPLLFATQNQFSNERRILLTLLGMDQLDGVLVEGTKTGLPNPNIKLYQKLMERGVPLVFMHGNYEQLPGTLSVLDDNVAGGRMLVEYLYEKGHRRISGIFKFDDLQGRQRFVGYMDAMQELGLPLEDGNILWYNTDRKDRFLREGFDERQADAFSPPAALWSVTTTRSLPGWCPILPERVSPFRGKSLLSALTTASTARCLSRGSHLSPTSHITSAVWQPSCFSGICAAKAVLPLLRPGHSFRKRAADHSITGTDELRRNRRMKFCIRLFLFVREESL